ncbi:DUF1648 domain-containing protein [Robiginitalea sp. IMCC44478]|uniref:DUF1648 domain-containing protein n=1 Tax=Robiginitalea sp. IMCC44478 TaxID=3459122 RepID=UPI00404352CD
MTRPKITIEKSKLDRVLEVLSFILILSSALLILIYYNHLPEELPIHFNTTQKDPNGYGNKSLLWQLPIILGIIVLSIIKLSQYPHVFNYPIKIRPENVEYNYKIASQMLRVLATAIGFTCFVLTLTSILNGLGLYPELVNYVSPFLIGLLFGIPVIYLVIILIKQYYPQQRQ